MKKLITILIFISCLLGTFLPVSASTYDEVSNEQEFLSWLKTHQRFGGTLILQEDIEIRETLSFFTSSSIQIQTNGHTLHIYGFVQFIGQQSDGSSIQFIDTKSGCIQVEMGGMLALENTCLNAVSINQMEGGILDFNHANILLNDAEIHYAKRPIIDLRSNDTSFATYKENDYIDKTITKEMSGSLYYQGASDYNAKFLVHWQIPDQFPRNEKQNLEGDVCHIKETSLHNVHLEDAIVLSKPKLSVLKTKSGIGIVNATYYEAWNQDLMYTLDIQYPQQPTSMELLIRYPHETVFHPYPQEDIFTSDIHYVSFMMPKNVTFFFVIEATIEGNTYYSNVLQASNSEFLYGDDVEGNRGGGSSLIPEEPMEPIPDDKQLSPSDRASLSPTNNNALLFPYPNTQQKDLKPSKDIHHKTYEKQSTHATNTLADKRKISIPLQYTILCIFIIFVFSVVFFTYHHVHTKDPV